MNHARVAMLLCCTLALVMALLKRKRRLDYAVEKLDPSENPPTMRSVQAFRIEN